MSTLKTEWQQHRTVLTVNGISVQVTIFQGNKCSYQIELNILEKQTGQAREDFFFAVNLINRLIFHFFFSLADLTGQFLPWLCAFRYYGMAWQMCILWIIAHIAQEGLFLLDTFIALGKKAAHFSLLLFHQGIRKIDDQLARKQLTEKQVRLVLHRLSAFKTKKQTIHSNNGQRRRWAFFTRGMKLLPPPSCCRQRLCPHALGRRALKSTQ